MRRVFVAAVLISFMLVLWGCGDGSTSPHAVTRQILSDPVVNGDISFDGTTFAITQNASTLLAGEDPATSIEYRAFMDFPLGGAGGVPGNAVIQSATLEILIDNIDIQPAATRIPLILEMVSFPPPTLASQDYNGAPLISTTITAPIFRSDVGAFVRIDVTPFMVEAQRSPPLSNLQIRVSEDPLASLAGRVHIDNTTELNRPLLEVTFF